MRHYAGVAKWGPWLSRDRVNDEEGGVTVEGILGCLNKNLSQLTD